MVLGAAIVALGTVGGCTPDDPAPVQPRTGPPDLVLWLTDTAPRGVAADPVLAVAGDRAGQRQAVLTGTWPGFPARHTLAEVLTAVGYHVDAGPGAGPPPLGAPHFRLLDAASDPGVAPTDPGWPHTLILAVHAAAEPPFLVLTGGAGPATIPGPASALDVLPTLLDAAGTVAPAGSPGRSLLDPAAQAPDTTFQVLADGGWLARSGDLSLTWPSGDLAVLAQAPLDDPGLAWHPPGAAPQESLRGAMVRWQVSRTQDPTAPPLDPALKAVLEQRGYW